MKNIKRAAATVAAAPALVVLLATASHAARTWA